MCVIKPNALASSDGNGMFLTFGVEKMCTPQMTTVLVRRTPILEPGFFNVIDKGRLVQDLYMA